MRYPEPGIWISERRAQNLEPRGESLEPKAVSLVPGQIAHALRTGSNG